MLEQFDSLSDTQVGQSYATSEFGVGKFSSEGGCLVLSGGEVTLRIPEGALEQETIIYILVKLEEEEDGTVQYAPTYDCGPDGLEFKVTAIYFVVA